MELMLEVVCVCVCVRSYGSYSRVSYRLGEDPHAEPALHQLLRGRAHEQEQLRLRQEGAEIRGLLRLLQR